MTPAERPTSSWWDITTCKSRIGDVRLCSHFTIFKRHLTALSHKKQIKKKNLSLNRNQLSQSSPHNKILKALSVHHKPTSAWQLMLAFSFLISLSRLLAGLKVVIIANRAMLFHLAVWSVQGKPRLMQLHQSKVRNFSILKWKTGSRLVSEFKKHFFFSDLKDYQCENEMKNQSSALFQQQRGWTRKSLKPEQKNEARSEHFWFVSCRRIKKAFVCVGL